MWVYLNFMRRVDREQKFVEHPIGIRKITGLTLTTLSSFARLRLRESSRAEFYQLELVPDPLSR
jgi:hypothetical protein